MAEKKDGKLKALLNRITVFVTKDIWSFELYQKGPLRRAIANTVKVVVIAVRTFIDDKVMTKAAALTYSTLFAVVPILALIFAIARGFGFENIVTSLLKNGIITVTCSTFRAELLSVLDFSSCFGQSIHWPMA